jgi:hypothetical protein
MYKIKFVGNMIHIFQKENIRDLAFEIYCIYQTLHILNGNPYNPTFQEIYFKCRSKIANKENIF